jgi:AbrB family looped-hinge helix DNA binding protein
MCVAIALANSARHGAQSWDALAEWYDLLMSRSEQVTVGDRGRVVLPASIRTELGLKAGTRMLATTEEDGSVRLQPYRTIAARARGMFADLAPGVSLADELIAERRAEAARDE